MKVVVVGSSAAGQFAALLMARAGHEVLLLDRDDLSRAADVETAAATALRPAAPQIVQPHALLPRCRLLLRQYLPDVHEALLTAGAVEAPLSVAAPPGVDLEPQPGDDDFIAIATRRSTLDLVLRRTVVAQSGVTQLLGRRVTGLIAGPETPPRIRGVRTDAGDLHADLVVDATGRRTQIDTWLADIGAAATELLTAECGLAYYSRHYRVREGSQLPGHRATRLLLALDEFTTGLWNCDNGTAMIVVAPLVQDHRFRPVKDPAVFDAVVRTVPPFGGWLDVLEAVGDVFVMGGLHNTWRRLVTDDGPIATGLALVGDSRCTTNPTFGRGLPLALIAAVDLVDAIERGVDDPAQLSQELEARANQHLLPFYADQARNDSMRLARLRHTIFGASEPDITPRRDAVSFAELRQALPLHADAVRNFWRVMGMLDTPDRVYTDPLVVRRTRDLLANSPHMQGPPQPTTSQLEAALSGHAAPGRR